MKAEIGGFKLKVLVALLLVTGWLQGQIIQSGEIVYERRTNLEKRYEGSDQMTARSKKWLKEPKIDQFKLLFDGNASLFVPIEPEMADEDREWATMKNTTFQDFNNDKMEREFSFYGSTVYLEDSIKKRTWYITDNSREIAGFQTKQAVWIANDTTRIYAWYSEQIVPSVGPESYNGLPGAILGLAIEDGGVVYFAKEVKPLSNKDFATKKPKLKPKTTYKGEAELKEFIDNTITTRMGSSSLGRTLDDFYVW